MKGNTSVFNQKLKLFFAAAFMVSLAITLPSAQAQTFKVLHQFNGAPDDGANPEGALLRDAAGNLYGTTFSTSEGTGSTIFTINSKGKEKVLFIGSSSSARDFNSALIQDQAGNLVGIADGGSNGGGIVFKLSQEGELTQLFGFQGGFRTRDPKGPSGGILMDKSGNIFGATILGGNLGCFLHNGCGTLFRLDPAGKLHELYKFSGGKDGSKPYGPLVEDADGNLYGVTQQGGNASCPGFPIMQFPERGCGTVFKISKDRVLTVLHTFMGGTAGAIPQPGLLRDAAGNIYGTTFEGGTSDNGTVFKIASDGTFSILHRFTGQDGTNPNGSLVSDPAGNLYGTTQVGGRQQNGTAWKLSPDGRLKLLHTFTAGLDGARPVAGLIRDADGHLYGTTVSNGLIQRVQGGNVFEITP